MATAAVSSHSTVPPEPRCGHGLLTARATRRPRHAIAGRCGSPAPASNSVRSITRLVTNVMAAADVDEPAHGQRRTLASRLVRDHGRDLALVADVLGHTPTSRPPAAARAPNSRTAAPYSSVDDGAQARRPHEALGLEVGLAEDGDGLRRVALDQLVGHRPSSWTTSSPSASSRAHVGGSQSISSARPGIDEDHAHRRIVARRP